MQNLEQGIDHSRRKWLALGGVVLGCSLLPGQAWASLSTSKPKVLTLSNINTGEKVKAEFFDGKNYVSEELTRLNFLLRDYRANQVTKIDKKLFEQLYRVQLMLGTKGEIQLISGYRSPKTNKNLRQRSSGVAKHSYHTLARAVDFRIEGASLSHVRKAALKMRAGGVGYYPKSNFVHIDTGPVRTW
ncbi:MAG: DUF882 domain-containing protein [Plesiomonas sp.]|uniref:DUF882 domain-containing protein n=1 Tax=Plesiomonas sp. TaxID=2486279 RepID=UPI003EE4F290